MKELNLHLGQGTTGPTVLRTGDAEKIDQPKPIVIIGRLSAPFDFLEHKNHEDQYNAKHCHLIIDRHAGQIVLHANEKSSLSEDVITGCLAPHEDLLEWGINTEKRWTVRDFIKFIRARKYFFAEGSENLALIENLQKWNVTVERIIKEENNNTGNSLSSLETKVTKALEKTQFKLDIPIYHGYNKCKFVVEIGLDPKSTSVDLFLVSPELHELVQIERDRIFREELAKFDKLGFQCSRVNIS